MKHCYYTFICLFSVITVSAQTLEDDRQALLALYNATNGPGWTNKTGWSYPGTTGENPCGWFGVSCEGGRVTELNLANNRFQGTLPVEIGNLTALKSLNLEGGSNGLYTECWLNGALPVQLGNLVNLDYLNLGKNHFTGTIPESLGNLRNLKYLDLNFVPFDAGFDQAGQLTGSIPEEIGKLDKLEYLDLGRQNLNGYIPVQIGDLTALKHLSLSSNLFTGSIPSSFTNLKNLSFLDLGFVFFPTRRIQHGSLGGIIPSLLGIPTSAYVDLSGNLFTFDGMEDNLSHLDNYSGQKNVLITETNGILSVAAGGTITNNTYKWYKNNVLVATKIGNKEYSVSGAGIYKVIVTNSVAVNLTLTSENYEIPLPVALVSFKVENKYGINLLSWKTTSVTNNKGFEVEKSADARNFKNIGFIDGNRDSKSINDYGFLDKNPFAITYYRLKQIDRDETFEYSSIIALENNALKLSFYPNPGKDKLFISGLVNEENVTIQTMDGRVVLKEKVNSAQPININNFSSGLYIVKVGNEIRKVMIQK